MELGNKGREEAWDASQLHHYGELGVAGSDLGRQA